MSTHSVADIFKCSEPTIHRNKELTVTTVSKVIDITQKWCHECYPLMRQVLIFSKNYKSLGTFLDYICVHVNAHKYTYYYCYFSLTIRYERLLDILKCYVLLLQYEKVICRHR
jgi:hypothetical protein